jgi:hypothetical protein
MTVAGAVAAMSLRNLYILCASLWLSLTPLRICNSARNSWGLHKFWLASEPAILIVFAVLLTRDQNFSLAIVGSWKEAVLLPGHFGVLAWSWSEYRLSTECAAAT